MMSLSTIRIHGLFCLLACALFFPGCTSNRTSSRVRPTQALPGAVLFRDAAASSGLNFQWGHSSLSHLNILDTIGHGCAFLDYDGDGKLDVLLVGNARLRLYRNRGGGAFEDVTERAFPHAPSLPTLLGCAVADYDGDGRPDIFVTGHGRTILYHNEGNGTFRDATPGSGLQARGPYDWTTSAAWADVDGDGRLDLYVCRYVTFTPHSKQLCAFPSLDGSPIDMACGPTTYPAQQGSLYHNEGNGHFRDITRQAGLGNAQGNALGCMFCDYNGDGKPDLYIANDQRRGDLYVNLGGRFRNVGIEAGVATGADGSVLSGMGMDWGDYDNDGRFDLLLANFAAQPKALFHNEDHGLFTDSSYLSGFGAASLLSLSFGAAFVDTTNNGRLDIVLTNGHVRSEVEKTDRTESYAQSAQLFRNLGNGHFSVADAGIDFARRIVGRGIAIGDYDGDGRQDLLIVNDEGAPLLLHNESPAGNHWLSLRCVQGAHHADAVGARVRITVAGHTQVAEERAGGSYLSTNAPGVHFGLGKASRVDMLEVRWPNGRRSVYRSLPADQPFSVSPDALHPVLLR